MILDSLNLQNIRSHKDTTITFHENITLFSGDIGSGKSTILMGIEFALFGLGSFKAESLLSRREPSGEVVLKFHMGTDQYEIGRRLVRDRNQKVTQDSKYSYLMENEQKEPLTTSTLKTRILDILGLNEPTATTAMSRIYRYAISTPQDEMKTILWDPDKRLETIRKAFRIEDYQIALKNTDRLKSFIREEMIGFEVRFENLAQLESERGNTENRIREITQIVEKYDKDEQSCMLREREIKAEAAKMEERVREKGVLERRRAELSTKIESEKRFQSIHEGVIEQNRRKEEQLRSRLAGIDVMHRPTARTAQQIQDEIVRFGRIHDALVRTRSDIEGAERRINALKQRFDVTAPSASLLRERVNALKPRYDTASARLDVLSRDRDRTNTQQIQTRERISMLKDSIVKIQGLGAKCHLCGHILTQEHLAQQEGERKSLLEGAENELSSLSTAYDAQTVDIEGAEQEAANIKREIDSLEAAIPYAEEYANQLVNLEQLRTTLSNHVSENTVTREPGFITNEEQPVPYLSALRDALLRYESAVSREKDTKAELVLLAESAQSARAQLGDSEKHMTGLLASLREVSDSLHMYDADARETSRIRDALNAVREERHTIREFLSAQREALRRENENLERLGSDIQTANRWKKKHHRYDSYWLWLNDFFIPSISMIEKSVLQSIRQEFNESYSNWYGRLIDDPTKNSFIDEEFAPIVEQDGYTQDIHFLSGGEKTSVALAYRLALNFVMRRRTKSLESNLLILDEPTDGFSRAQLVNVREILGELNSKQIILVSHEPELESHVDHVYYVRKEAGTTDVSIGN